MTIRQFIEKSIEGGWMRDTGKVRTELWKDALYAWALKNVHEILLDPLAWKAVGKVEGWGTEHSIDCPIPVDDKEYDDCSTPSCDYGWKKNMHRMIDALAEGKTIEQYLETL